MKRDVTVWISLTMIVVPGLIGFAMGMPQVITERDPPLFHILFWIMFIGVIRGVVLWFQTLIHGVEYAKEENRVAVVLGHIFLGPLMSYGYYLSSRMDAKEAANQRLQLTDARDGIPPEPLEG